MLEYNGKQVHAHRAILRMSSPFFDRILQSQWPVCAFELACSLSRTDDGQVAKGPVFSLGDDDDPDIIDAMLRHMYNLPYSQSKVFGSDMLKFHVDVFMLADKYDCPSLRSAAVSNFRRTADWSISSGFTTAFGSLIKNIANLCGSDAVQTADPSLRDTALNFCAVSYTKLFTYVEFRAQLHDGSLFDADAMTKLLVNFGELALKKDGPRASSRPLHNGGRNCLGTDIDRGPGR